MTVEEARADLEQLRRSGPVPSEKRLGIRWGLSRRRVRELLGRGAPATSSGIAEAAVVDPLGESTRRVGRPAPTGQPYQTDERPVNVELVEALKVELEECGSMPRLVAAVPDQVRTLLAKVRRDPRFRQVTREDLVHALRNG